MPDRTKGGSRGTEAPLHGGSTKPRRRAPVLAALAIATIIWLGLMPPRWWLNLTKKIDTTDPVRAGAALVEHYDCRRCHLIAGRGALNAPDLTGVTDRLDRVSLRLWLRSPRAIDGDTAMPDFRLSDSEIDVIVAYFESLDRSP